MLHQELRSAHPGDLQFYSTTHVSLRHPSIGKEWRIVYFVEFKCGATATVDFWVVVVVESLLTSAWLEFWVLK